MAAQRKQAEAIRDLPLVGVRIAPPSMQVLQIARAAYGYSSLQEMLRPVIERYADDLLNEPEIAEMVRNAAELRARKAGTLSRLVTEDSA